MTIFALGFFDGVHIGHAQLLRACRELAQAHQAQAGVVTFGNHPDGLVTGSLPQLINTPADREWLLTHRFSMDQVVALPFDRALMSMSWQDFLGLLRQKWNAAGFVCGEDFRFGFRGQGTAQLLAQYCRAEALPCTVIPDQLLDGIRVSSTWIRQLLLQGQMEDAVRFLGHPHILRGTVLHGKALGRRLGIPTANLALPPEVAAPKLGVYACRAEVDGQWYTCVTNVGTRPTVSGTNINAESWLLDFTGNLYGKELTLEFYAFLRPEQTFDSLAQMQTEIQRNAQQVRDYFQKI